MKFRSFFLCALVGFSLQIVLHLVGPREILRLLYEPWFGFGEAIFPSGAGGHALPGGAMLGWIAAILLYSLIIGTAIYLVWGGISSKSKI
jgi:hypothetical protein